MHLRKVFFGMIILSSFLARAEFKALPVAPQIPADNPQSPAKIELGKMLFFDPRFSTDGTVSCNSCHNVMGSGADDIPESVAVHGHKGGRGSLIIWNSAFQTVQFWEGRAATLEDGILYPSTESHEAVITRIKQVPGYIQAFKKVFPQDKEPTIQNAAKAVAAYERTLITPNSSFDRYLKGNKKAMNAEQISGMKLVDEVGCTACHTGENFSGDGYKMGEGNYQSFPQIPGSKYDQLYDLTSDLGRYEVTKKDEDKNLWRVPTWRNVALTAPYFHNGKVKTLDEAVRVMAKTQLGTELNDSQVADIIAFLNALTGQMPKQKTPVLPK